MTRPKGKLRRIVLTVLAVVVIGLLLNAVTEFITLDGFRVPATAADRDLAVTETALAQVLEGFEAASNRGAFVKQRMFDGGSELDYRFDPGSGRRDRGFEVLRLS